MIGSFVALSGVWYVVVMIGDGKQGRTDVSDALMYCCIVGVFGLRYAWQERFGFGAEPPADVASSDIDAGRD